MRIKSHIPVSILLISLLSFGASNLLPQQAQPVTGQKQDEPKSALEGRVLRAGTDEPIAGAQFVLSPVPTSDGKPSSSSGYRPLLNDPNSVMSDREGRFLLSDIDPGSYFLLAISDGFARQCYGAKRPGVNGCGGAAVLKLEPGKTAKDVVIRMTRGGVISGRITDPGGQSLTGIAVDLRRNAYDATGQKSYMGAPDGTVFTNDRGEYRMYGIDPGSYFINTRPSPPMGMQPGALRLTEAASDVSGTLASTYEITFYPGVPEITRDSLIEFEPGAERTGINFSVRRSPSQKYRIRGRIVDTRPGQPSGRVGYSITPIREEMSVGVRIYYTAEDGTFESPPLVPGSYRVQAEISSPVARPQPGEPPPFMPKLYASAAVDVASGDVEGVLVTFVPPLSIPGRLSIEGRDALPLSELANLRVRLRMTGGNSPQLASIREGGTFTIENASAGGEYALTFAGLPLDMYVKEARYGDNNLLGAFVRISGPRPDSLNVVLGENGGRVDGVLRNEANTPVAYTQAVLIPDLHRERRELYKSVTTDEAGRFTFRGIPPGDYKIFAWEDIEPYAYFDDDFINQSDNKPTAVHISDSEKRSLDVRIIPVQAK